MRQDQAAAAAFLRFLTDGKEESGAAIDSGPTSAHFEFLITHEPVPRPLNLLATPASHSCTFYRGSSWVVAVHPRRALPSPWTRHQFIGRPQREQQPFTLSLALTSTGGAENPGVETCDLPAAKHRAATPTHRQNHQPLPKQSSKNNLRRNC